MAVGKEITTSNSQTLVATSTDGSDWSYHWLDAGGALLAVEWTGSCFVAVGANGLQFQSVDGISWEGEALDEAIDLSDLAWNGDRLVAIGGFSGVGPFVMTSSGNLEWEVVMPPEGSYFDFDDVLWTGNRFVAVGLHHGDLFFVSTDGISWSSESTGTGLNLMTGGGDNRTLLGFARGDRIIRRKGPLPYNIPPRRVTARISPVPSQKAIVNPVLP